MSERAWRLAFTVLASVVVLAAAATLLVPRLTDNGDTDTDTERLEVLQSFVAQVGTGATELRVVAADPDRIYVAYWTDELGRHVAWAIDGLWVEVYRDRGEAEPAP